MKKTDAITFLDAVAKKRVKATLRDHILTAFPDIDYAEYRSTTAACRNRLRAGQSHNALLGTTIFPSIGSARGVPAKWCGNVTPMLDAIEEPKWTESRSLVLITNALNIAGPPTPSQAHHIAIISKLGAKGLAASLSLISQTADYADRAQAEKRELNARLQRLERQMEELRRMLGSVPGGAHIAIAPPTTQPKRSRKAAQPSNAAAA